LNRRRRQVENLEGNLMQTEYVQLCRPIRSRVVGVYRCGHFQYDTERRAVSLRQLSFLVSWCLIVAHYNVLLYCHTSEQRQNAGVL